MALDDVTLLMFVRTECDHKNDIVYFILLCLSSIILLYNLLYQSVMLVSLSYLWGETKCH